MKQYFFILLFGISSFCFSQIKSKYLAKSWGYESTRDSLGNKLAANIKPVDVHILEDNSFEMEGEGLHVKGSWSYKKPNLILEGSKVGEEETRVMTYQVHSVSKHELVFVIFGKDVGSTQDRYMYFRTIPYDR